MAVVGMAANPLVPARPAVIGLAESNGACPAPQDSRARHSLKHGSAIHRRVSLHTPGCCHASRAHLPLQPRHDQIQQPSAKCP